MTLYEQIGETVDFLKERLGYLPQVGVVLGSGLGEFADSLQEKIVFPYDQIPHFKKVGVKGHAGRLVVGKTGDKPVVAMQGRYHYYEGHDIAEVVFPIRILCSLGIHSLLLTNAAGGIDPNFSPGDLMVITDHINMMGINPLRGENDDRLGVRFPDMTQVYSQDLIDLTADAMQTIGLKSQKGVYLALSGPSYETPAEIRMLTGLGANAVGMSTVPEAIVARQMKVKIAGISCITNLAAGISSSQLNHKEVTETAQRIKGKFINLLELILPKF